MGTGAVRVCAPLSQAKHQGNDTPPFSLSLSTSDSIQASVVFGGPCIYIWLSRLIDLCIFTIKARKAYFLLFDFIFLRLYVML